MKKAPAPISVFEAREIVRTHVKPGATEKVAVLDAVGRVLAEDLFSDINVAPFDDSAMDGYAVIASDIEAASEGNPVTLKCVAHLGAGDVYDGELASGQTIRIMTGCMVPAGADAVEKYESVIYGSDGLVGDDITFTAPVKVGRNIRRAGEEAHAGDKVMEAGEVITTAGAGLLAACGNLEVTVYARPKVGVITIGSELTDASEVPGPGMIRDSNVYAIQAAVVAAGGIPQVYPRVSDSAEAILETYTRAAEECDAVVSTGGACLGDFDLTGDVLRELGTMHFERANVKPGKSQPFGEINGKPVFILSGNPAASAVGFELYARMALRIMQGYTQLDRPAVRARITADVNKKGDSRLILERAVLALNAEGELEVTPLKKQSSALYGALQRCNCLVSIPEGQGGKQAGDMVDCIIICADEALPFAI